MPNPSKDHDHSGFFRACPRCGRRGFDTIVDSPVLSCCFVFIAGGVAFLISAILIALGIIE